MSDTFDTLSEFINWIVAADVEGGERSPGYWFRGHPHQGLALEPRVLRPVRGADNLDFDSGSAGERVEQELNRQFRREAASLLSDTLGPIDLYFLGQHHGLPTRLLDWTTNGLAALFFTAVNRPDADGEVIAAMPDWRLTTADAADQHAALLRGAPFPQRHPLVCDAVNYLFGEAERPAHPVILPILPDLRSPRMLQQGACFTLHLPGSGPVREQAVARFVIPSARKPQLLRALRAVGISWSRLFPDLDHLCRELGMRWDELRAVADAAR